MPERNLKRNCSTGSRACFEKADETEAILKIIAKKRVDPRSAAPEQLHKLYGYLARKGFRYEDIRQVIQNYEENA